MGWKVFAVCATATPGYFGTAPTHDPAAAEVLRQQLSLDGYTHVGEEDFDAAIYPQRGSLYIGAYAGGCILCQLDLPDAFFDAEAAGRIRGLHGDAAAFRARVLALYPQGEVMALVLHSVVNLWGYSVFKQGRLLRTAAGASDDGLFANEGEPLPEELAVLQRCPIDRVDEEGEGEELVFDVSARMFGRRLDSVDALPLRMTEYRRTGRAATLLRSLFGRR